MFDSDDTTTIINFDNDEDKTLLLNERQLLRYRTDHKMLSEEFQYESDSRSALKERSL